MYSYPATQRPLFVLKASRVEIKSFVKRSPVQDVRDSLGQYLMYRTYLAQIEPDRKLYMAASVRAYRNVFTLQAVQFLVQQFTIAIIVVDIEREEVIAWNE